MKFLHGLMNDMECGDFLNTDKSILIAPAGCGKTYTIAKCVASYEGEKKILILTHTHAGIASLREKLTSQNVNSKRYRLETICSFALELTKTYHINKEDFPSPENQNSLFRFAVEHATKIVQAQPIREYLSIEFEHLIVDEYQDCTESQHSFILALSNVLKTHLLGDELQGIFSFNERNVNFSHPSFQPFFENKFELTTPWRWNNNNQEELGRQLLDIRDKLIQHNPIDLRHYPSIEFLQAPASDYTAPRSEYKYKIYQTLTDENVLIIHPESATIAPRIKFIQQFPALSLIESIDEKLFYSTCQDIDEKNGEDLVSVVLNTMSSIGKKAVFNNWFNNNGKLKNKRDSEEHSTQLKIAADIESLIDSNSLLTVLRLMDTINKLPGFIIYRKEFYKELCNVLREAERLGISASAALERNRNIFRRRGRKVIGKSIATTLLTKGLEFDTVVVLNAKQFHDSHNFYVAITRCCKRLVIISETPVLQFS